MVDIAGRRLHCQRLSKTTLKRPGDVAAWMGEFLEMPVEMM